jgi:N6-adenosine-specific RNA methylase IME4
MPKYQIIYADPPWPYYGDPNKMGAAGKEYALMTLDEIAAMPIRDIAADPSVLFLWTTSVHLLSAAHLMDAWGFTYRGVGYVWVKTTDDGYVIAGQGVRPSFTKPTTEFLLVGSTQPRGRPFPLASESQPQVVLHPRLSHSEKPEIFRELIESLFEGEQSRIELFARRRTPGWDALGNEVPEEMRYQQSLGLLTTLR